MKKSISKYTSLFATLAIALVFASCDISGSNSGAQQDRKVAVKMTVQSPAPQKIAANRSMQSVDSITEVKLLLDELELESALDQDSLDFEVNDLVVNLPLDGSDFVLTSEVIPEGVYDEFEMEIDQPDDASVNDPDFYNETGDNDDDGYSIVVAGTYNGQPFTYRSQEEFELEMDLNPPLEVSDNSTPSVAINVDPFSWFKDEAGNALDPTDPANYEQINENIRKSFGAEKDDDDGNDDNENDDNGSDD